MPPVRLAQPSDQTKLALLRHALWPEGAVDEHEKELTEILAGRAPGAMPYVVFVCESDDENLIGFVEVSLRSHADGCDPSQPVGFLEGWYVSEDHRRRGLGAALLEAAERWSRAQGCAEMASDAWIDADISQRAHEALGFEVVDRCVHYRKK